MDDYIEELLTNHEEDFGIYELDDASDMDDAVEIQISTQICCFCFYNVVSREGRVKNNDRPG